MHLIVGLGNPDKKYFATRHNIGFHAIDYISQQFNIPVNKLKHKALIGEGKIENSRVILAKPQTYMNNSGESVREILDFYKLSNSNIIVIYDDVSLDLSKIRIRAKGSSGGHNGIKSIINHLQNEEFCRIKIGVGMPKHENYDLADFVLSKFSKDEEKIMFETLKDVSNATKEIIKNGTDYAMNKYNG